MIALWVSLLLAAPVAAPVIQFDLHSHLAPDTLRTNRTELREVVTHQLTAAMLAALVGLGLLALTPIALERRRRR